MDSNIINLHWKMLNSTNSMESLDEKYKGPKYCNTCYNGNADACPNVRNFI